MLPAEDLAFAYRWGADTMKRLVSDVPDEDFARQPVAGVNHPAWLLGHVSVYHEVIAQLLRGESFDNPWDAPCGKNSEPSPDRSQYRTKEGALARFDAGLADALMAIASASAEAWTAPMTHPTWGKQFKTGGGAVLFLATSHLSYHTGQLSGWRRAMALPRL
ncbi:MAG: DinB family protein [Lacipirellulaceae bacterium]